MCLEPWNHPLNSNTCLLSAMCESAYFSLTVHIWFLNFQDTVNYDLLNRASLRKLELSHPMPNLQMKAGSVEEVLKLSYLGIS